MSSHVRNKLNDGSKAVADALERLERDVRDLKESNGGGVQVMAEGFHEARNESELKTLLALDKPVVVARPIRFTESEQRLTSSAPIKVTPTGRLLGQDLNVVHLDCPLIAEPWQQVFGDFFVLHKTYDGRWGEKQTTFRGTFGGHQVRHAGWWGARPVDVPHKATREVAGRNALALNAAAMSGRKNTIGSQIIVLLQGGAFPVLETIRLDGVRCTLAGHGANASQLWAYSENFGFLNNHTIRVEEIGESTPVVEIGYERQAHGKNPDEGFFSGVAGVGIKCPLGSSHRYSGIMWESGLQEGSRIEDVSVANHSGVAIGGPIYQRLEHNGDPQSYYTQLNQVEFRRLWITGPNAEFKDARALMIGGKTWGVYGATIDHGRDAGGVQTKEACRVAASEAGIMEKIHFEYGPGADAPAGVGVLVPGGFFQRLHLRNIGYLPRTPDHGKMHYSVVIEAPLRGSITCEQIMQGASSGRGSVPARGHAIWDKPRGKKSTGTHYAGASSTVGHYSVEATTGGLEVITNDPGLR